MCTARPSTCLPILHTQSCCPAPPLLPYMTRTAPALAGDITATSCYGTLHCSPCREKPSHCCNIHFNRKQPKLTNAAVDMRQLAHAAEALSYCRDTHHMNMHTRTNTLDTPAAQTQALPEQRFAACCPLLKAHTNIHPCTAAVFASKPKNTRKQCMQEAKKLRTHGDKNLGQH